MITSATITTLYDYGYWINARVLAACEALTAEQWDRSLGHSWGSVHAVLVHMLAAEIIWLTRWQGESPRALRQPEEFPALADVRRMWSKVEADMRDFIRGCDDARLARDLNYTNTRGQSFSIPLGQLMLHVANHGTHHRGELAAMLAILDVPHPEDDLIRYFLEMQESKA